MKNSVKEIIGGAVCFAVTLSPTLADTRYVDINNSTPSAPFTSWTTAANDIQSAVDSAVGGETILVADGTYEITSRIKILKNLTLQSVNGPENVIVNANGNSRVFNLKGQISLEGLTITGGYASHAVTLGGGVFAFGNSDILISDCIVENNESPDAAGGISIFAGKGKSISATIQNCIVRNNVTSNRGGGIQVAIWGSSSVLISKSLVQNNRAGGFGGGIDVITFEGATGSVLIEDCTINTNQSLRTGGGGGLACHAAGGIVDISRCQITYNSATRGGGVRLGRNATVSDSLIHGNETTIWAGGGVSGNSAEVSQVANCTITGNRAKTYGGGLNKAFIYNSIVFNNDAGTQPNVSLDSIAAYSCAPDLISGINGNINSDPQFVDPAAGDYRLMATSPCIDAGTNAFVWSAIDLGWNPRISDGDLDGSPVVDMGAYEFQLIEVRIDIKPDSDTNPINLKSKGRCPVAVLTTEEFDAGEVDPPTVRFAGAAPVHATFEDVDADGDVDLVLHFKMQELNLSTDSTEAMLIGQTHNGQLLAGVDAVRIVPQTKTGDKK